MRLQELKQIVTGWPGPGTLVLVTHAFTVRALLGFLPYQGKKTVVLELRPDSAAAAALVGLIAPSRS